MKTLQIGEFCPKSQDQGGEGKHSNSDEKKEISALEDEAQCPVYALRAPKRMGEREFAIRQLSCAHARAALKNTNFCSIFPRVGEKAMNFNPNPT